MVRPNIRDLYFVGFSTGFVIRDTPGNLFYRTVKLSSDIEHTQNPLSKLHSYNLWHEDPYSDARETVTEFLLNINNYSGTVIPAP